jgi:hypothetical protein
MLSNALALWNSQGPLRRLCGLPFGFPTTLYPVIQLAPLPGGAGCRVTARSMREYILMMQTGLGILILYSGASLVAMGCFGLAYHDRIIRFQRQLLSRHPVTDWMQRWLYDGLFGEDYLRAQGRDLAVLTIPLGIAALSWSVLLSWGVRVLPPSVASAAIPAAIMAVFAAGSLAFLFGSAWVSLRWLTLRSLASYWAATALLAFGCVATALVPLGNWLYTAQLVAAVGALLFVLSIRFRTPPT